MFLIIIIRYFTNKKQLNYFTIRYIRENIRTFLKLLVFNYTFSVYVMNYEHDIYLFFIIPMIEAENYIFDLMDD